MGRPVGGGTYTCPNRRWPFGGAWHGQLASRFLRGVMGEGWGVMGGEGDGRLDRVTWRRIRRPYPRHKARAQHLGRACHAAPLLEDALAVGRPLARRLAAGRILGAEDVRLVFKVEGDELDILIEGRSDEGADRRYRRSLSGSDRRACRRWGGVRRTVGGGQRT